MGDTTSNQALIFSPPFSPVPLEQPSFPNYTLPSANATFPPQPSSPRNYTLVFTTTSSQSVRLSGLPRTTCAVRAVAQQGNDEVTVISTDQSEGMWLRDPQGWRWQWLIGGLTPQTNYTMYMLQAGQLASTRPVNFVTKAGAYLIAGSNTEKTDGRRR